MTTTTTKQLSAGMREISGQEVAKSSARLGKSDLRYWQSRIFRPEYKVDGERRQTAEWSGRIQHQGRRELFPLGTSNAAAAAARARDIYRHLVSNGWDAAIAKFKSKAIPQSEAIASVGEFVAAIEATFSGRAKTFADYVRALRKIGADIEGIDGGKKKYDHATGGRDKWLTRVNAVSLSVFTPEALQKWKLQFLSRAGTNPVKVRSARVSVNSLLRQAKSLFSPARLKFVRLTLPTPTPFALVEFEPRQSMRYRSTINVEKLFREARAELSEERMKIFLLAVMVGLRRHEIDLLCWDAFLWDKKVIRVAQTEHAELKSEDSADDVDVEPELMKLFKAYAKNATGDFVVHSAKAPKPGLTYTSYRCDCHFRPVLAWLRSKGVNGFTPIHTLRKEFGSVMCDKHGIHAASLSLRHADIGITSQHYVDKRSHRAVGLGHLLAGQQPLPGTAIGGKTLTRVRRNTPGKGRGGELEPTVDPHQATRTG